MLDLDSNLKIWHQAPIGVDKFEKSPPPPQPPAKHRVSEWGIMTEQFFVDFFTTSKVNNKRKFTLF